MGLVRRQQYLYRVYWSCWVLFLTTLLLQFHTLVRNCTRFQLKQLNTVFLYNRNYTNCLFLSGLTGIAVLSLASIPFRNVIGYLYISQDNKLIKVSSIDFWGNRKDRIVDAEDWIPLLDMKPKPLDAIYLSPQLSDGTKYKLLIKFGNVLNSTKMGQVLEQINGNFKSFL